MRTLLFCAALTLIGSAAIVSAQEAPDGQAEYATTLGRAQQLYKEGRFEESLQEWTRAYEMKPFPRMHQAIAKCYQQLGQPKEELKHLELYLATDPDKAQDPVKLAETQNRVATLRNQLGVNKTESLPVYKRAWFWSVVGIAAAGAAAGIAGGVVASQQGAASGPEPQSPKSLFETGPVVQSLRLQFAW